jgi:hypothetical protein
MRARVVPAVAALVCVAACSGDLFHSTDWTPPCAGDGCGGSSDGGAGATGAEGGAGAAGTGAGGQGGEGGEGAAGGAPVGGGGAGGDNGCQTCAEAVLQGPELQGEPFCPMSADLYDAVHTCACAQNGCPAPCLGNLCASAAATAECATCVMTTCTASADACVADSGG